MRSEECCKLFGIVVERNLVIAFVGVEDGVPPLSTGKRTDLLPRCSFRVAGPDAELVEAAEIDTKPYLAGPFLGNNDDGVQPVVGFWSLLDRFENSGVNLLLDFVLERLKVCLGDSAMSTGRRWNSVLSEFDSCGRTSNTADVAVEQIGKLQSNGLQVAGLGKGQLDSLGILRQVGKQVESFSGELGLGGVGEGQLPAVGEGKSFRDEANLAADLLTDENLVGVG